MRVLLVEDDRMVGAALQQALRDAAYAVDWVRDATAAHDALTSETYEIVLLDLGLPGEDGIALLRRIRARRWTMPVLIVTARDGLDDRIGGLDVGADDYLVKPFETRELLARMRAVLRRPRGEAKQALDNGVVTLDPATFEARTGATARRLTAREFSCLHALMLRPGTILSRPDLEARIYGWNEEVESNAVEFLIHSVRKKLGNDVIRNVRGVGWMVDRPV